VSNRTVDMSEQHLTISYQIFEDETFLSSNDRDILEKARLASINAYAPYSHFRVGAALQLLNGEYITGNNQENAAFPSGLCAERVAIFYASSQFPGIPIVTLAIYAQADEFELDQIVSPCGSCRQVISEYEHLAQKPIRILMKAQKSKILVIDGIENLLPFGFSPKNLNL